MNCVIVSKRCFLYDPLKKWLIPLNSTIRTKPSDPQVNGMKHFGLLVLDLKLKNGNFQTLVCETYIQGCKFIASVFLLEV